MWEGEINNVFFKLIYKVIHEKINLQEIHNKLCEAV